MSIFDLEQLRERTRSAPFAYGLTVAVVAVATWAQWQLWPFIPPSPQLLFYPAVLLVASVAGLRPAIVAVALSTLAQARWFLAPPRSFAIDRASDMGDLAIYVTLATTLAALVVRARASKLAARDALRDLRAVVQECPIAIVIARKGGRVIESNAAATAIYGRRLPRSAGEVPTTGVFDAAGRELAPDERPLARALRGERLVGVEIQIHRVDGDVATLLVDAAPLDTSGLDGRAAVVAFQDISTMKELEALRAQWNAIVAHDLRQPINSILLSTQLLSRNATTTQRPTPEPVETIARATRRLNTMVQDLLDASRLEVRNVRLNRRRIDLETFLAERVAEVRSERPERRFELALEAHGLAVRADPLRLAQVLGNLLGNAVKYGDPKAPIRVAAGREGDAVYVAVENEGEGLSEEEAAHVFERFRRTASSERRGIEGTGLGLYIVRELVVAHGGAITCRSVRGGKTSFRFRIPAEGEHDVVAS